MRPDLCDDFPILKRRIHGRPLVYLDNAATTQKPQAVIDAIANFYRRHNANVHRGVHALSDEATQAYETARVRVADLIGAPDPAQLIFTRNATEAINLVAHSWGLTHLEAGDAVLLTRMEHHANLIPWQRVAQARGARLLFLELDSQGRLRLDDLDAKLARGVKLVALTHVSNVLGTINPVAEICARARSVGARLLVDGAQSAPHLPVDVRALGCDFFAFSAHKMLGPTGIGALYGRPELLAAMPPYATGGEMIRQVSWDEATWADPPAKFEAGTPSIAQAVGWGAAVAYLTGIGLEAIHQHERALVAYALERLGEIEGLRLYGPGPKERGGVLAFNLPGVHPHDLADLLDDEGIAIRAGHHCAQPLVESLGVAATARASFYLYNTHQEVDALVEAIHQARKVFAP